MATAREELLGGATIKVTVDDRERLLALVDMAVKHGFMREDPRRRWSKKEEREAARFAVEYMIRRETR